MDRSVRIRTHIKRYVLTRGRSPERRQKSMSDSDRAKKFRANIKLVQAMVATLAAASALVIGACLSGLPATTCGQLAHAYYEVVQHFGNVVVLTAFTFVALYGFEERTLDHEKWTFVVAFILAFAACVAAMALFTYAVASGYQDVGTSLTRCYSQLKSAP